MDASKSDVDFDSYWDEEARNPNRNRIRIGRQYQAQCPAILKTGESDGRNLEDLETLTWNPHNPLTSHQLNQYFAIAKSIGLFIQAIDTCQDGIEETECLEEEKCTLKPFEILDSGTKCVLEAKPDRSVNSTTNTNTSINTNTNVITNTENKTVTTRQRLQQQQQQQQQQQLLNKPNSQNKDDADSSNSSTCSSSPLKQSSNTRIQTFAKGLPAFILSHHRQCEEQSDKLCDFATNNTEQAINLGSSEKYNVKRLAKLLMGRWNDAEAKVFARAIKECGKNFSAIKKDYLPWKSVKSIVEFYYLTLDNEKKLKRKLKRSDTKTNKQSPIPENKKRKDSSNKQDNSDNNDNNNNNKDDNEQNRQNNNDNDKSDNNQNTTDQHNQHAQNDDIKSECSDQDYQDELSLLTKSIKSGNLNLETKFLNCGNINGNSYLFSPEVRSQYPAHLFEPGQEVKALKAKPILSHNELMENGSIDNSKANLGSLNVYFHGELVLRFNAQQQESGQKWVESIGTPARRRHFNAINNGFNSSRSGSKRTLKDDADDISLGGGDASASDDDSMTSNESSSLVASSPSSSSTITTSAAKKARVKVENFNNIVNGNNLISSPNSSRKCDSTSNGLNNNNNCKSQPNSNNIDNSLSELDFKKKFLEYYQMGINGESIMLLASTLFNNNNNNNDPPKAHSNSKSPSPSSSNHTNSNGSNYSPIKETPFTKCETTATASSSSTTTNGYTNGFMSGPVDLTRKSSTPSSSNNNHSTNGGDTNNNHHKNRSSPSFTKKSARIAHESSSSTIQHRSSSSLSSSIGNSNSLFSLPAPPPPNVSISPNKSSINSHRRSSSIRNNAATANTIIHNESSGIHQFAK